MTSTPDRTPYATALQLEEAILARLATIAPGKTIAPSDIAVLIAGNAGDAWGALMPALRKSAVRLANEGKLTIYRKGKLADPNDFKGVYRLGPVREE